MEVAVQLDPKDVETYVAFVRSRDRLRRVLFPILLCPLIVGALWLRVARSPGGLSRLASPLSALLIVGAAVAAIGLTALMMWRMRGLRRELVAQACVPLTLTLSASGITGEGVGTFATTWAQVRGFADTGSHIIIMLGNILDRGTGHLPPLLGGAPGYIVPKRCFRDEAQRTTFLAELRRHSRPLTGALKAQDWRMVGYLALLGFLLLVLWATWPHHH